MGNSVFNIPYEIIGDGVAIARDHYAKRERVIQERLGVAESLGGIGVRLLPNEAIFSIIFAGDIPEGFRKIYVKPNVIEAVPHKGTRAGEEAAKIINAAPRPPHDDELFAVFGWRETIVIVGDGKVYKPTLTRLTLPTERFLMSFPVAEDKPWSPPETLRELKESEYLAAFAAHNAEVEKRHKAA